MKKNIISVCLIFMALISFAGLSANYAQAQNPLVGSWVFNVVQAPWNIARAKLFLSRT
jgi:hypothetical protein